MVVAHGGLGRHAKRLSRSRGARLASEKRFSSTTVRASSYRHKQHRGDELGTTEAEWQQHGELLPGLGAFPLRPGPAGDAQGAERLEVFLSNALDHVAQQATQHERDRYWRAAVHESPPRQIPRRPPAQFLASPPADSLVLLGYVKDGDHRRWIQESGRYNVRAGDRAGAVQLGGRELGATLLALYERVRGSLVVTTVGRVLSWQPMTRDHLLGDGYPSPGGEIYFVAAWEPIGDQPNWLADVDVARMQPDGLRLGAPFVVTWLDLLRASQPEGDGGLPSR